MATDMSTRSLLSDHLATRARSLDFATLGLLLPNPDPILKAQGKDIAVYRDMTHDALIGSCIGRRKAAVQALEWGLDRGHASSRVAKAVQAMLDALPLATIIEQMQDCTLYGYQPMEVIWGPGRGDQGGLWLPSAVLAKPPEWFCFDAENMLRFKSKEHPLFGEPDPGKKYLLPRKSSSYQNPYGFADLSMCYWPLLFKKGGMRFWLAFTEKFGSAFMQGKLPRSATTEERATLLDSLEALIQNGVAVIPDDGSIEPVEVAGKSASADLYEKLVLHCSSEIAIALLGQNQTTQASANKASATAGLEVVKDLRDADAEIVAAAINQLIAWVCEINFGGVQAPVFSFWDQAAQDVLQAARDKSNYDAGARFTNAYWIRGYGYQEGDLRADASAIAGIQADAATAFADPDIPVEATGPLQAETDLLVSASGPAWNTLADQLQGLVNKATSFSELQKTLVQAYGDLDSTELVKLMAAAMALAELKGMDSVRTELQSTDV
jgi:phage gp29-like protein